MALTRTTSPPPASTAAPAPHTGNVPLWDSVDSLNSKCVLMETYGEPDSGKSTFALTAPGPIAYIHSFEKVGGLIQRTVNSGKEVRPCGVGGMLRGESAEVGRIAKAEVRRLENALTDAYAWARTIVIDNHTDMWHMVQLARLGSMTQAERSPEDKRMGQLVYGEMNAQWNSIIKQFRVMASKYNRTNLILIGKSTDEYKGNQATGRRIAHGMKDNAGNCDVRLCMKCELVPIPGAPRGTMPDSVYSATVVKPWYSGELRGFEVPSVMLTFPAVMGLITGNQTNWE